MPAASQGGGGGPAPRAPAPVKSAAALLNPGTPYRPPPVHSAPALLNPGTPYHIPKAAPPKTFGGGIDLGLNKLATSVGHATGNKGPAIGLDNNNAPQNRALAKLIAQANGPQIRHSSGGPSLSTAAIANAVAGVGKEVAALKGSGLSGFLERGASDVMNLPKVTLQGLEGLGIAGYDDFMNKTVPGHLISSLLGSPGPNLAGLNYGIGGPNASETSHLIGQGWHQSVLGHLARGDVSGAVKTFSANPVYGAQEFTGLYGALGRTAGAVARSGALGSDIAKAASTERARLPLVPGLAGDVQHHSKNYLTMKVQQGIERHPSAAALLNDIKSPIRTGARLSFDATTKRLRMRANEFKSATDARVAAANHDLIQASHDTMPKNPVAAGVMPQVASSAAGAPHEFVNNLERLRQSMQHESSSGTMGPRALKNSLANQANLEKFINHPDVQALAQEARASSAAYAERRAALEHGLSQRGLLPDDQALRRSVLGYAHTNMDGVFHESKGVPTAANLATKQAAKDINRADKAHADTKLMATKLTSAPGAEEKAVTAAEQAVIRAEGRTKQVQAYFDGRYGKGAELPPAAASNLDALHEIAAGAREHLTGLRQTLKDAHTTRKQTASDALAATKDTLNDAKQTHAAMSELPQSLKGHMILDPNTTMGYRQLGTQEIIDHMNANGVDPASYVKMATAAERRRIFGSRNKGRGGTGGKEFTGQSVLSGSHTPGYGALTKSQQGTLAKLQQAITTDEHAHQFGQVKPSGQYFTDEEIPHAAAAFESRYGIPMVGAPAHPKSLDQATHDTIAALQNPARAEHMAGAPGFEHSTTGEVGHNILVPREIQDQLAKHQALDEAGNPIMGPANNWFRKTVLPFSPKWAVGNGVEGLLRSAMTGSLPGRTGLINKVLPEMHRLGLHDEAGRIEHLIGEGQHFGMQEKDIQAAMGTKDLSPRGPIRRVASAAVKPYGALVKSIFSVNHKMESSFTKSVVDTHMRNQLQELTGSMLKSATAQHEYITKLAQGYADPALAADVTRYTHQTLGQYNTFGPAMKKFTRTIAPFSPWYFNSLRFSYYTLPLKHPVLQTALLDANRPIEEGWAKDHSGVPHGTLFPGLPIGSLLSDVKTGPKSFMDFGRFTPAGAFTNGPVNYGLSMIGPQFSDVYNNLGGSDAFNRPLSGPHGKVTDQGQWALQAINSLASSFLGPTNVLSRIVQEHGDTPYNTSKLWDVQLKPNTHHGPPGVLGGLQRVLNPLEPVYLAKNYGVGSATKNPNALGSAPKSLGSSGGPLGTAPPRLGG